MGDCFNNLHTNIIELAKNNIFGPCFQGVYGDYIFGNKPLSKIIFDDDNKQRGSNLGYFASNIVRSFNNFIPQNCYELDLNDYNYNENTITNIKINQEKDFNKYTIPLFMKLYDLSNENKFNQTDIGTAMGIPRTLLDNNSHLDRMIAELVNRAEHYNLIKTKKENNYRYIYPGDITKIPENFYDLSFNANKRFSIYEAYINYVLKENKINTVWQIRLSNLKNSPYDFGILDNENNLIGVIEVQGEQHSERIKFFHPSENDFLDRLRIDNQKKEVAINEGLIYLAIDYKEIKKKNAKNNITKKIKQTFNL